MLEQLISRAPETAAIVIVVLLFLRHLKTDKKTREAAEQLRTNEWIRIADNCHDHTKELNERASSAIDAASGAIQENTKALGAIGVQMQGCADRVNGKR